MNATLAGDWAEGILIRYTASGLQRSIPAPFTALDAAVIAAQLPPSDCLIPCDTEKAASALNDDCFCLALDREAFDAKLTAALGAQQLPQTLAHSHPNLFATLPVFVAPAHLAQTAAAVQAIDLLTRTPRYRETVLAWAPEIARFDPGSPGGLLGFDFHLSPSGPKLIEINTNPGGVLLNAVLLQAQHACLPALARPNVQPESVEDAVFATLLAEWRLQQQPSNAARVAIIDEQPQQQYLYPEFLLYQALLKRHGIDAEICSPEQLQWHDDRLWHDGQAVDFVYNRLTDFSLVQPTHAALRAAYLSRAVALSPHPQAHAIYADKRNLSLLCDAAFLASTGIDAATAAIVHAVTPKTQWLTAANRDQLWAQRRGLFFKPSAGYGSKASYRGDKLTRRVWDEILTGSYVAQEIVPPSLRRLSADTEPLKVDLRCYAYNGAPLLYAARIYQGQTTNFRTPGGGFAPVLTAAAAR